MQSLNLKQGGTAMQWEKNELRFNSGGSIRVSMQGKSNLDLQHHKQKSTLNGCRYNWENKTVSYQEMTEESFLCTLQIEQEFPRQIYHQGKD